MNQKEFKGLINEVKCGKCIIEKIMKSERKRCIILLFPDCEENVVATAYKYLDSIAERYEKIIFVSNMEMPSLSECMDINCKFIHLGKKDMDAVLRYAQAVEREPLRIVSYVSPAQIDARELIGVGGITKENYLYRALYGNFSGSVTNG